ACKLAVSSSIISGIPGILARFVPTVSRVTKLFFCFISYSSDSVCVDFGCPCLGLLRDESELNSARSVLVDLVVDQALLDSFNFGSIANCQHQQIALLHCEQPNAGGMCWVEPPNRGAVRSCDDRFENSAGAPAYIPEVRALFLEVFQVDVDSGHFSLS